jgi:hypothetical protein
LHPRQTTFVSGESHIRVALIPVNPFFIGQHRNEADCPVEEPCSEYALANRISQGVSGDFRTPATPADPPAAARRRHPRLTVYGRSFLVAECSSAMPRFVARQETTRDPLVNPGRRVTTTLARFFESSAAAAASHPRWVVISASIAKIGVRRAGLTTPREANLRRTLSTCPQTPAALLKRYRAGDDDDGLVLALTRLTRKAATGPNTLLGAGLAQHALARPFRPGRAPCAPQVPAAKWGPCG